MRRRAEHALQRSEEKFAAAFRSNPCAMAITLFDEGTIVDVNDVCVRQSGYAREELIGSNSDELGFWVDPVRARERHRRARGARPRRDPRSAVAQEGRPGGHGALFSRHARGRRRALRALGRRGHHRAQAGRGHAPRRPPRAARLDLRPERRAASSSIFTPRIPSGSPRRRKSFLGKHMKEVLPPDVADGLLLCFDRAMRSDDTATLEYSLPVTGEVRFFEARVVRCDVDKVLAIVRDITERRRAERQARATARRARARRPRDDAGGADRIAGARNQPAARGHHDQRAGGDAPDRRAGSRPRRAARRARRHRLGQPARRRGRAPPAHAPAQGHVRVRAGRPQRQHRRGHQGAAGRHPGARHYARRRADAAICHACSATASSCSRSRSTC